MKTKTASTCCLLALAALLGPAGVGAQPFNPYPSSERCQACHNALTAPDGQDVSIGTDWRSSVMAQAARDPYWQASVRREALDHPAAAAAIEGECSRCHMPLSSTGAREAGGMGQVFANLTATAVGAPGAALAIDGVSCTACHQIQPKGLGEESTFSGHYPVDGALPKGQRPAFGPFAIDEGRASVMRSATGFTPTEGGHLRGSELCATCHTLFTHAYNDKDEVVGELPEQVPYLEWLHSDHKDGRTCQECHLVANSAPVPITNVLGEPRAPTARHVFRGGNAFLLGLFNRFRDELAVTATAGEVNASQQRTLEHLQTRAARLTAQASVVDGVVEAAITVTNLAGHKLPTAYPSRRAWLHVVVRDAAGKTVFESGALSPNGAIAGNDNDLDPARYEPHYTRISAPDQVQIYEPILAGPDGKVTTGLLTAASYVKDNRVLPQGFDKATAPAAVAPRGGAAQDEDFEGGGDQIVYAVPTGGAEGPFEVKAELWYQPIGFRWAQNLKGTDAAEPRRFVRQYEAMAATSATLLARVAATAR